MKNVLVIGNSHIHGLIQAYKRVENTSIELTFVPMMGKLKDLLSFNKGELSVASNTEELATLTGVLPAKLEFFLTE